MNIKFSSRAALYSIMTDEVARKDVYTFAETHKIINSQIHESFDGEVYLIDFYISKDEKDMNECLKKAFEKKFDVEIGQNYVHVFKKTES